MRQILKKMHVTLYLDPKSKHVFSVHQHIIMLVLRQYESKSYESLVEWLEAATEVITVLGISTISAFYNTAKDSCQIKLHFAACCNW